MQIDVASLLFYVFAFFTIASGVMVITAKNPVHSVLFLIFAFFNAAGLFVLLGAEYLAMTLVIVYVGAVAVLFLFVVMMLDIHHAEWRQGFVRNLPLGIGVAVLLFIELATVLYASHLESTPPVAALKPTPDPAQVSNTEALGRLLYTDYVYAFQLAGIILLVAMVGAIVLTLRERPGVRKQKVAAQVARRRADGVELVKVEPGEGA